MFQGTASEPFSSRGAGPFQPAFSAGESLTPVADVSDLFGSHWGIDEERFEASGEEINRRWVHRSGGASAGWLGGCWEGCTGELLHERCVRGNA